MTVDTIRQVAEWLADPTTGINAIRADVPTDVGDSALLEVVLANSIEDEWAARGFAPREVIEALAKISKFSVTVIGAENFTVPATAAVQPPFAGVPIGILVEGMMKDSHTAQRQAYQLLRCAIRSINLPFNQPGALPSVTRHGVEICRPDSVTYPTIERDRADVIVLAAAIVVFPVSDPWALGA